MRFDRYSLGELRPKVREIGILARGIDDNHQAIPRPGWDPGRHQIVEDAACLIEQQGIAHPGWAERLQIAGNERLQRPRGGAAAQADLSHMRNIEEAGLGAGMKVLGDDAGRVLHRHLVPSEPDHAGAAPEVQLMQRRLLQRRRFGG